MTEERAVLAGGCFRGMQDLFRRYDGVGGDRGRTGERVLRRRTGASGLPRTNPRRLFLPFHPARLEAPQ